MGRRGASDQGGTYRQGRRRMIQALVPRVWDTLFHLVEQRDE